MGLEISKSIFINVTVRKAPGKSLHAPRQPSHCLSYGIPRVSPERKTERDIESQREAATETERQTGTAREGERETDRERQRDRQRQIGSRTQTSKPRYIMALSHKHQGLSP